MTNPLEQIRELLPELMSACEMIGYATSGNERANHKASRDKIKAQIIAILTASQGYVCVPVKIIQQNAEDVKEWEEFGRQIEKRLRHNDLGLVGGYPEMIDALLEKAKRLRALERAIKEVEDDYMPGLSINSLPWIRKRAAEILREGEPHDQD